MAAEWAVVLLLPLAGLAPVHAATNCTPPASGLIAWWPGDGNAFDIVANNLGSLMNGATFTNGLVGPAFQLDGVNDFVEVPLVSNYVLITAFSVEGWVLPRRDGVNTIASQYDTQQGQASWAFDTRSGGKLDFGVYSGGAAAPYRYVEIGRASCRERV